ncbi:hypothetical protein [Seonamhaeicola sp.]|uniref:hypothetical protein n=1 Tax=Seonamhaeicola sp. TaxID=1912245 RepID=UPI002622E62F|nr:hypothetical protein [Seonamhaeicola sp.]
MKCSYYHRTNAILFSLVTFLVLSCNAQRTKQSKQKTLDNTAWIIVDSRDAAEYDSIKASDVAGTKTILFSNDTIKEFFGTSQQNPARQLLYTTKGDKLQLQKDNRIFAQYTFKIHSDTLIIFRQGRHGIVQDIYTLLKN